jgi:branched-chain amino acid transport system substrate-binding protein
MKIGILYPRSNAHPGLMVDFMDGIKISLKQQGLDKSVELLSESIGFGGLEKEVYEKTEKLVLLEKVDVLVAYIDLKVAPILAPLMYSSGKLLLIVNPGANYPDNWVPQPGTVYLTLQHAFCSWLSGSLAGKMKNKNGLYATTFYDCGYMHGAAILKSFAAGGGNITFNYVNNQLYNDQFDIKQLADFLLVNKETDNLLCVMDSLPALLFYKLLNELEDAGKLHLFVSPMMLQEEALKNIGEGFSFSIDGYLPWMASQENSANKVFANVYQEQTQRDPSVFSLLGWETGLILKQVIEMNTTDSEKITDQLANIKIDSPRGTLKLDKETNYFIAPIHQCSIKNNSIKIESGCIEDVDAQWKAFTEMPNEGTSSGWLNTYLCY